MCFALDEGREWCTEGAQPWSAHLSADRRMGRTKDVGRNQGSQVLVLLAGSNFELDPTHFLRALNLSSLSELHLVIKNQQLQPAHVPSPLKSFSLCLFNCTFDDSTLQSLAHQPVTSLSSKFRPGGKHAVARQSALLGDITNFYYHSLSS